VLCCAVAASSLEEDILEKEDIETVNGTLTETYEPQAGPLTDEEVFEYKRLRAETEMSTHEIRKYLLDKRGVNREYKVRQLEGEFFERPPF
jgi:Zn-dependent membrane protease YugP